MQCTSSSISSKCIRDVERLIVRSMQGGDSSPVTKGVRLDPTLYPSLRRPVIAINKKKIVDFGVVSTKVLSSFDIKQEVLFADFNWQEVINLAAKNKVLFKSIPKYPAVKRDLALLLDDTVSFKDVYDLGLRTEKKLIKNISLFDVFVGDKIGKGKKSYAVSFTILDEQRTLTDKQIDKIMNKLQGTYKRELNAELR